MSPILKTRRLVLRPPELMDAEPIARYLNNFAVVGNLARVPYPYSVNDAERWLASLRADVPATETGFAIELSGAGYIGNIGFHPQGDGVELGYWLAEPFWHRGIMTEAAAAAVDWFFGATDRMAIQSGVFHFNKASLAVQRKLGFIETGISSRHCLARGEQVRHIDTQLSRADWAGAKT